MSLNLILYSRSNCPLCEAMEDELRPFIEKYSITVKRQYIDNEAALQKLYGDKVPVLTLNNEMLCHYFLDTEILLKAITE
ncbi:MAG: glutaredoxin family protein [Gammaproteobacteria bacterium]|nr:MAG: glutaredoxin family protein [Gammaproteobacteria bacterium]